MDIEQTLENLTLNKGKLDYATILKLQETLADACRIHDETHADEMAAVLEKMRLRGSEGAADAAAPQPAYDFTSPGRGAASDAQWSPTPLGADGERSVERHVRVRVLSQACRRRRPSSSSARPSPRPTAASRHRARRPRAPRRRRRRRRRRGAKDKKGRQARGRGPEEATAAGARPAARARRLAARAAPAPAFEAPDLGGFHIGARTAASAAARFGAGAGSTLSMDVDDEPPPPPPAVPPPPAAVPGVFAVGAPPPAPPRPRRRRRTRSPAPQSALSDAAEPQSVLPPEDAPMDEDGGPTFSEGPTFTVGTQSPDRKPAPARRSAAPPVQGRRRPRTGALEWYERAGREYEGGDYDGATRSYGVALKLAVPGWALARALGNRSGFGDAPASRRRSRTATPPSSSSRRWPRSTTGPRGSGSRSACPRRRRGPWRGDAAGASSTSSGSRLAAPHDALNALQTADAGLVDVERYKDALRRCGAALDGARQKAREAGRGEHERGASALPGQGRRVADDARRAAAPRLRREEAPRRAARGLRRRLRQGLEGREDALLTGR
ncbi:protein O-mannosyl-transferase [Aureococcus anophagefferens]|uniref:Protein O-mannosyl-transferase n=1 Tax=Aureococcus anophagefferens TaxID=44056 RepID=A0ABR1FRF9_AURAN